MYKPKVQYERKTLIQDKKKSGGNVVLLFNIVSGREVPMELYVVL